jgi:hypothetical protein
MLRVIASSALHYAVDGVIPGSAVGHAARAERLEEAARTRVSRMLGDAETQADSAFHRATAEGYAQGYADAVAAFIPQAMELLQQEHMLAEAALEHVGRVLRSDLERLGFETPMIAQWCSLHAGDAAARATLRIPSAREDLADALAADPRMRAIDIRLEDVAHPLLEVGKLAFEFDPDRLLLKKAASVVFDEAWQEQLSRSAATYAERVKAMLNNERSRERIKSLEDSV